MNNKTIVVMLLLVGLFGAGSFGAAIYFWQDGRSLQAQVEELTLREDDTPTTITAKPAAIPVSASADQSVSAEELKNLNAYIDKLESENSRLKQLLTDSINSDSQGGERNGQRRGNRGRGRPNLEELKESNPEEYARIQKRMEDMRKRMEERANKRNAFLASVDTSRMTATQKSAIADYQSLLAEMEELRQNGDFRGSRELGREVMRLQGTVQTALLENLGSSLGSNGEDFANQVMEIMEASSPFGPPRRPPPPPGGNNGRR